MADKTISGLPALPTIAKEDVLLVVDNPAGTPVNRKISVENFFSNVEPIVFFSNTKGASSSEDASVVFRGGVGIKQNLIIDGNIEIRGSTVQGTTTIGAISDSLVFTNDNKFDVANTSNALRTIYVGNVSAGESGTINVYSNSTVFYSNVVFNGSNLHVNSTSLNVQSNTSFFSNVKIESSVDSFIINSDDLTTTSNFNINGNDLNISSNTTVTGNFTHAGKITLFDNDQLVANSNTFIAYGNVMLGLWSSDGNPKGTTSNVYISSTNTYIKSDLTFKGTRANYFSNLYVTSQNTSITSSNTHLTSDLLLKGNSKFVGNTEYNSTKFSVVGSNNYFKGKFTTTSDVLMKNTVTSTSPTTGALVVRGGVGIVKDVFIGGNLNIDSNLFLNDNVQFLGPIAEIQSNTEILGSNTYIRSNTINIIGNTFNITSNSHFTSDLNSSDTTTGALIVDGGVGIAKDTNVGGNLRVDGNIHAVGNITANGSIQLGDQPSDTISLAGRVQSDIVPAVNATYNLGVPGLRFANGLFKDVYTTANATINDSLLVLGKRGRFQANVEFVGPVVNSTANSTFTGNIFKIYGQNAHVTSNLTVDGTQTVLTSNLNLTNSNVDIQTSNFDLNSTDLTISSNSIFNGSTLTINHSNTNFAGDYVEFQADVTMLGTSFNVSSNSEITGTTLSVTSNTEITGSTLNVSSDISFTGSTLDVSSNTEITGSTLNVSSDISFTGSTLDVSSNTEITGSTLNVSSDISFTGSTLNVSSDISFTGSTLDVSSNTEITGSTLNVSADIIFTGSTLNVSSDISFTGSTLNVSSNTEITGSTLNVSSNTIFTDSVYHTGNLNVLSNVSIVASNTHINSDVEIIGSQFVITSDNTEINGSNTHLTSNINVINTSTVITNDILQLNSSNTIINGNNYTINSNVHVNNSNTFLNVELLNIQNGQLEISSNVYITSSNSQIMNLTSNNVTINSELVALGNVYFGQDGSANDIIIYGKTSGEKIKYDSLLEKLIINTDVVSNLPLRVESSILFGEDQTILFDGQIIQKDTSGTEGTIITEDDNRLVLEDLSKDKITSEVTGLRFKSLNYVFGLGNSDIGFGSTNVLVLSDGNRPLDSSSLPADQSHLYSKKENIVNSSGIVTSNGSYLHTLSSDGYESVLGIHNTDGDLELLSRNTANNLTYRINIFELARAIETLTGSPAGTYLKQE
jgi:hypothetical protein